MRNYVFCFYTAAIWLATGTNCSAISFDDLIASYGNLTTVAGAGQFRGAAYNGWESSMEGGSALDAELSRPHIAMSDLTGNIYIADKDAHAIRLVSGDGTMHTVAGTSEAGFNGDAGLATEIQLNSPNGIFTRPDGTTYIYDLGNNRIGKLSVDGIFTTLFEDFDGMVAGRGLWVNKDETLAYYSSGTELKMWTPDEGVEILADGFAELGNLDVNPHDGSLVVTDRLGHGVYKVDANGQKTLVAGNESDSGGRSGMPATSVGLDEVRGIYFHPEGGYFLATHKGGQVWFVDEQDTIHLLVDGDTEHETHYGDGQPLSVPGRKISEPRAVTLAPNGDILITENDFGFIRHVAISDPWFELGDFDADGELGVSDINAISQIVQQQRNVYLYDVTGDGTVTMEDRTHWIKELKQTNIGDANLDGVFNSGDFVQVFQAGQYEDAILGNSTWNTGDWNGDGDFTSADFVEAFVDGGYVAAATPQNVPEPFWGPGVMFLMTVLVVRFIRNTPAGSK
ncbi:MAG: hypothetical protein R3C28_07445 [Pirellulaceae bacterium]